MGYVAYSGRHHQAPNSFFGNYLGIDNRLSYLGTSLCKIVAYAVRTPWIIFVSNNQGPNIGGLDTYASQLS